MIGLSSSSLGLLLLTAASTAGAAVLPAPPGAHVDGSATPVGVEFRFDFSGMDAFWEIAGTLDLGEEPTEGQWRNLLGSPGYQALTRSEFGPSSSARPSPWRWLPRLPSSAMRSRTTGWPASSDMRAGDGQPEDFGDSLRQSVPQSGHPTGYFMGERVVPENPGASGEGGGSDAELDLLVDAQQKAFLLETLERIDPPERIQDLFDYAEWQHQRGGGFHGLLPDSLDGVALLPVPENEASILEAALVLAQRRQENHKALAEVLPTFPFSFRGDPLSIAEVEIPSGWGFTADHSAISGFLDARSDGVITAEESRVLAGLATNREMLEHRKNLGYVPEPLPSAEDLAEFIARAGSADPLDRLWAWLHPWNFFGYADVATEGDGYSVFVSELELNERRVAGTVLSRLAAHAPEDVEFNGVFALTIGCLIRGWATTEMPGLNVDQVKDDWQFLIRVMVHETYHKVQPSICPTVDGGRAADFEDLAAADLGDPGLDGLYGILAYAVLEGTANYAAGPDGNVDSLDNARAGSELLTEFVRRVVDGGESEAVEELIVKGLKNNGPLYALGYRLSADIAGAEGSRAVGEWLARGPVAFVLHAHEISSTTGQPLLDDEVVVAVKTLQEKMG